MLNIKNRVMMGRISELLGSSSIKILRSSHFEHEYDFVMGKTCVSFCNKMLKNKEGKEKMTVERR